ncbi:co-chaperonin GroES [Xanthomonas phage XaC1]|nr:co-chaperonin GroES [Xanthomonas phage XaC1]
MALKMINDFVLVKVDSAITTTKSGIALASVEIPTTGKVVSVGEGKVLPNGTRVEPNVQVGDSIIFGKSAMNTKIEEDGVDYYVMKIDEIFGKKK